MTKHNNVKKATTVLLKSLFLLPGVLGFILFKVLPKYPNVAENVFSKVVFRIISVPLGFIVSLIPVSITELLVIIAVPTFIFIAVLFFVQLKKNLHRLPAFLFNTVNILLWLLATGIIIYGTIVGYSAKWLMPFAFGLYIVTHIVYFYVPATQLLFGKNSNHLSSEITDNQNQSVVTNIQPSIKSGKILGWLLSCLFLLYMLMHGLNFNRQPLAKIMNLDSATKDKHVLTEVCIDLAKKASAAREKCNFDDNSNMVLESSINASLRKAGEGFKVIDDKYPQLWGTVNRAKPVMLSKYWSHTGITGMYFPFLCEANVNIDQPPSAIPATAAHEIAHTRGFAKENDCNFLACLACFEHPSPDYQYSGYLMAFVYCQNELYKHDKKLWRKARNYCSQGVELDLSQRSEYWKQFEGKPIEKKASKTNDKFIKSHGVPAGIKSYDHVVELIVAWYEDQGLV